MARGLFTLKHQLQGVQQKTWNAPFGNTYGAKFAGSGSGQYLLGPTTSALNFGTGNFTVEFWLYMNAYGGGGLTLAFSASNASADFQLGVSTSNNAYWHNSGVQIATSSSSVALGRWTHFALVRSGTNCAIFCNGTRFGTVTNSAAVNLTNFNVGSYQASPTGYMLDGWMSNLRITNTAVYDPTLTSLVLPTGPLTSISGTQLLMLQNATIIDNSTNALTITNNGTVGMQIVNPFGIQSSTPAVDYLVVAGGGGGGYIGGGGGAGGLLQGSVPVAAGSAITVTVGSGGAGAASAAGASGTDSVFGAIFATGGGGGGSTATSSGSSGGSGGGSNNASGGSPYVNGVVGQGIFGQGNAGGQAYASGVYQGGGGGGAGTIGLTASSGSGGNGGAGISSAISGTVTLYAGGGGGPSDSGGIGGSGGVGGGGAGGVSRGSTGGSGTINGAAGSTNTGGGGGGYGVSGTGGTGGSGIVILSYPDIYAGAAATTGSPTVSTSGSGSLTGNSLTASTGRFKYAGQTPFSFGTGDFTIEFWAYFTNTSASANYLIDFRGASAPTGSVFGIYQNSSGLRYFSSAVGDYGFFAVQSTLPTQNVWYSIAATRVSGTVRLFVNGTLNTTFTDSFSYSVGDTGPSIMSSSYYNDYGFNGYVSNFRIIKGTGLYTASYTPSTVPLTAVSGTSLLLNTVSGAYFADSSTNSYNPTVTNTMAWNQLSPFATGLGYKNRVYTYTGSGTITF